MGEERVSTTNEEYVNYQPALNEELRFVDSSIDNYGGAFEAKTPGRFLVPTAGYYHFSLGVQGRRVNINDGGNVRLALMADGKETLISHAEVDAENSWESLGFAGGVR